MTNTYPCRWIDHGNNTGHFEPADPNIKPIPYSGADETPPVFGRRWKLARDGFGLERDDEIGNYVDIDDALSVLHSAAIHAKLDEREACAVACEDMDYPNYETAGGAISDCAAAIRARGSDQETTTGKTLVEADRRSAACVKSCEGLSTEWLENNNLADCSSSHKLTKQRDNLLDALKTMLSAVQRSTCEGSGSAQDKAMAAIRDCAE